MTLTYLDFLVLLLGPPLVVLAGLLWAGDCRLGRRRCVAAGLTIVTAVGLVYTTPWDNELIGRGVWWYGENAVLATIWRAPAEEYLFMLLQPVLTGLWLARLPRVPTATTWRTGMTLGSRTGGVLAGAVVTAVGAVFLGSDATFYLGAILAWAGPVFALQWGFGWRQLWEQRRLVTLGVGVPTLYLAAGDRVAIDLGIWSLSPAYTTGVTVGGLPVEEGLFFLVTNMFVVQGLVLFLWVVDR
ncbi:lycopene cyclase domain-containing protein [Halogranum amylolyticum]|uniref:Lycopene cyclase domain-containing protein n=1 Tax=Halogranum amylolyticum TaxID=660520 RepID=A0A1H8RS87_9EURY|nr:lycopene cyclase domain-containing protein [Halogranum amylolyticum]SEO69196.1 lycopene cyclase domain-containing protein [Halogranum amylolyticum]